MMQNGRFYIYFLFALITITVLWGGCEDRTIDPFEEGPGLFSVYGVLSLSDNPPYYIRVKDLVQPFFTDSGRVLDATVTFEDLEDGTVTTLRDSVVEFPGQFTHNFVVNDTLEPNQRYRLTVENSRGESVISTAETPAITEATITPSIGANCEAITEFTFTNVERPERIDLRLGFLLGGQRLFVGTDSLQFRDNEDEVFIGVRVNSLIRSLNPPGITECEDLSSNEVLVRYTHFGPSWINYRGRANTDPTESLDIEGGLGIFGAIRRDSLTFTVDTSRPEDLFFKAFFFGTHFPITLYL